MLLTEDLFLGAYGLTRGGELAGIEVRGVNGKRLAVFRIAGADMQQAERDYYQGPALVNLRLLKAEVTRLKNLAFEALREEESRHAREQRGDRTHQGFERARLGRR